MKKMLGVAAETWMILTIASAIFHFAKESDWHKAAEKLVEHMATFLIWVGLLCFFTVVFHWTWTNLLVCMITYFSLEALRALFLSKKYNWGENLIFLLEFLAGATLFGLLAF